ncbi:tRNA (cytidine(34)-2'-O)-methyltransferase [Halodesulfovibrio spirochaetisodalis]|uniref:Putative tRNA (cytidine(34)-2'-O)-methyltransferase n=1 Tax=Halodesulfovibrio spirochaetisodalis TaxID=1560234 RepID=A0A1B7XCA9_9BACT|nr:tRNA (cytidine(34)-2'-O)-methyltransferase [Halodesulfovibrio spirochaetisodalis]OBQ51554.1 tRNA methyltransferase [Halodesulfovibrio spirochaetisodalis]
MHVVLFEPEIPPNTGNIARLCAATATDLHLIEPLGFSLDDKYLKRAGLDYWPHVSVSVWPDWDAYIEAAGHQHRHLMASAKRGIAVHEVEYDVNDALVFGPETRGLPDNLMDKYTNHVRIPMWGEVRSLNLSTAVGIVLYQAYAATGVLNGK